MREGCQSRIEPNLPAYTPPSEQNTLPGLLGAPQSHTRKGLVSVTSRNLLHPYGPKMCFQVIEKFAFTPLYLLPENTECFCSHQLQVSRTFIQNHATLSCQSVRCEHNFPKGPQVPEATPQSRNALMTQSNAYLGQVTEG